MITFGTMPQRSNTWTWFKSLVISKYCTMQMEQSVDMYTIYAYDGPEVMFCYIWTGEVPPSVLPTYSQAQNDADKADFQTNWLPSVNKSLIARDGSGLPAAAAQKTTASRATLFSHDWTNPTTWYSTSEYVGGEIATSVDQLTYSLTHQNVIDTYHGLLSEEDFLRDSAGRSYRVAVRVNGVVLHEVNPNNGVGDFVVNYAAGQIVFPTALAPADVVSVDYHYMVSSLYIMRPSTGKNLRLEMGEVQVSTDVVMTDSAFFQAMGLVDYFRPDLVASGAVPTGTLIPLGNPFIYKRIGDFLNDSVKSYAKYPALGMSNWRGMPETVVFNWDYTAVTLLMSAAKMEFHVSLENNIPFGGSCAVATFYCISEDA